MSNIMSRNEKLYRMLMTAYNDDGSDFLGFLVELLLINYRYETIPRYQVETEYIVLVPEAQSLMRELLDRDLVYIARVHGFPGLSSDRSIVSKAEAEEILADAQNWIGPVEEGPSAIRYRFCSTIAGESITQDSVLLSTSGQ